MSDRLPVYLVGPRYHHHANTSGYEGFGRYIGKPLTSPVRHRFLSHRLGQYRRIGDLGERLDALVAAPTPRPLYTLGILAIELATIRHMLMHRGGLYHVLYGDSDVWLMGQASRVRSNRLVATFHSPSSVLEWLRICDIARHLDAVVLLAESQRSYFQEFMEPERIFVVPHGVDTSFFAPGSDPTESDICITVGSKFRDFETLETAMALVWQEKPRVRLVAVGTRRQGDSNPDLGLEDHRVQYLDGISDEELRMLYRQSAVAIFPLKEASANNGLLEAMACGLPSVSSDVGGIREYLGPDAGLLCLPFNPEALAKTILQVLGDRTAALAMSQAARRRALELDYRVVAEHLAGVYRTTLSRRKAYRSWRMSSKTQLA